MYIKITKSVLHLGYGYRIGSKAILPDEDAKYLIKAGRAVALPPLKVKDKVEEVEVEPEVIKAVVTKTRKRKLK